MRAMEVAFALVTTRVAELLPPEEQVGLARLMEDYLTTAVNAGSPVMVILEKMEEIGNEQDS